MAEPFWAASEQVEQLIRVALGEDEVSTPALNHSPRAITVMIEVCEADPVDASRQTAAPKPPN
jgi:hypothetical protein